MSGIGIVVEFSSRIRVNRDLNNSRMVVGAS